jgi:hypothetical protein
MMVEEKYFLTLLVYNWDTSPRNHYVRHFVEGKDKAIRLAARLTRAVRANKNCGQMKWLDKHHHIYGFVERVDGVFHQTLERVG